MSAWPRVSVSPQAESQSGTRRAGDRAATRRPPGRLARATALALPVLVPVLMRAVFGLAYRRLGERRGYVTGFAAYWAGCDLEALPPP